MAASRKRVPGQGNDDDEARKDANADFLGTQSLQGGGDDSFVYRGPSRASRLARPTQRSGRPLTVSARHLVGGPASRPHGRMLKFRRNTLSGSHARLTSTSRARVSGG